jgi:uncharacterized membrane protein YeaQ/YmgE (transglycosylase-associated protein family)
MLQLLTWTATGLVAGGLARTLMRSRRDFGLVGDLLTGWFGALVGGWLFRRFDVVTPETTPGRILVSLVGAGVLLAGVRLLRQIMPAAQSAVAGNITTPAANLADHLLQLGNFERTVLSRLLNRERWSRDPNVAFDAQATFGERLADRVAWFGGSWTFIGIFADSNGFPLPCSGDRSNAIDSDGQYQALNREPTAFTIHRLTPGATPAVSAFTTRGLIPGGAR